MKRPLPEAALNQHIIALGKTGSGKSSKMRVLVEQLLEDRKPVCIVDPKGDWWGIKSSADSKHAGYPVVIFGGEHADVPLNPRAGAAIAELIFTGNRPALIDLRGWMPGDRTRFFIDFASTVFRVTRGTRYLVIDEVHNFAPKGKVLSPEAGEMLHWANRLASEGRGLGLTLLAASQRPQKVHNDLLTSCETLIACRVIHKADRDAIKDWIDGCADPQMGKEVLAGLAGMKRTEAWCWSPEIDFGPKLVNWPMFATYDSFKPQERRKGKLRGWAAVDLDVVREKLGKVVAEAEANDPAKLRARIKELEREVAAPKIPADAGRPRQSQAELQDAERKGYERGLNDGERYKLKDRENEHKDLRAALVSAVNTAMNEHAPQAYVPENEAGVQLRGKPRPIEGSHPAPIRAPRPIVVPKLELRTRDLLPKGNGVGEPLPKGEAAVLAACIQFPEGLERGQLTVLTGYKRSTRDAYVQRLGEKEFVFVDAENLVRATEAGRQAMPDAEALPTGAALQEHWFRRLPEGEGKILRVLVERHPDAVQRDELTEITGYKRSTRDAYLQRLGAKQLVAEASRGEVMASANLF